MMDRNELLYLEGFYENELTNHILAFWLPRCLDKEHGGYVNCFDNTGERLLSYNRYTWSQGRFVWLFSHLANTKTRIFSQSQRNEFIRLAKVGRDFLIKHSLMGLKDMRCVYLMERDGAPKRVEGWEPLDISIYADCFVVLAMTSYAATAGDPEAYGFGKRLYESILGRIGTGVFNTLPYPLSGYYWAHGIPMILFNVTRELYTAAEHLDPGCRDTLREHLHVFVDDILYHLTDEKGVIHKVIAADNSQVKGVLDQHANPGRTTEDMWFVMDAVDLFGRKEMMEQITHIIEQALNIGWDKELDGILHYSSMEGDPSGGIHTGIPREVYTDMPGKMKPRTFARSNTVITEPVERQVLKGQGDKL